MEVGDKVLIDIEKGRQCCWEGIQQPPSHVFITGIVNDGLIKLKDVNDRFWVGCTNCIVSQVPKIKEDKKLADRHNSGKVDTTFNPKAATLEWAKVWMFGAKKYERNQWKKLWGDKTITLALASANRHLLEISDGELFDAESGQTHAGHVMCNMAMIIEYMANEGMIVPEIYKEVSNETN